jgi:hypothetical protein
MSRVTPVAAAVLITAAAAVSAQTRNATLSDVGIEADGCRVVRILTDGRRIETLPRPGVAPSSTPRSVSVSASSRGGDSSRSTVSASSSSSGSALSSAFSTSSSVNGQGRTVSTTQNEEGCTVVIDERAAPGGRP